MRRTPKKSLTGPALAAAILAGLMLSWSASSEAFTLTGAGPRIGMTDPEGTEGTMTYGATLDFEKSGTRFHLTPNVMYWSEDDVSDVNPNFDVLYHFSPAGRIGPFAGAGVGMHFYDDEVFDESDSDFGVNLFGGLMFPTSVATFTVEGRAVLSDADQFGVITGATFNFGH
jgi:hypothetical protein